MYHNSAPTTITTTTKLVNTPKSYIIHVHLAPKRRHTRTRQHRDLYYYRNLMHIAKPDQHRPQRSSLGCVRSAANTHRYYVYKHLRVCVSVYYVCIFVANNEVARCRRCAVLCGICHPRMCACAVKTLFDIKQQEEHLSPSYVWRRLTSAVTKMAVVTDRHKNDAID